MSFAKRRAVITTHRIDAIGRLNGTTVIADDMPLSIAHVPLVRVRRFVTIATTVLAALFWSKLGHTVHAELLQISLSQLIRPSQSDRIVAAKSGILKTFPKFARYGLIRIALVASPVTRRASATFHFSSGSFLP